MAPWLESPATLAEAVAVGVLLYAYLLGLLRLTGNRTLAQLRAFDAVVTIALGTILGSTLLDDTVAPVRGVTAATALVLLQLGLAWAAARSRRAERALTSDPVLLLFEGRYLDQALLAAGVPRAAVRAALRQQGMADEGEALAVVLEPNGSLTALGRAEHGRRGALEGVRGFPPEAAGRGPEG